MNPFISTLFEIVKEGKNTNSYKFALWRSLARLAPTTAPQSPTITKRDLAEQFVEFYWPLEVKYHLRQGIDPDKDPIVMTLIRRLSSAGLVEPGEALKDFKRRAPVQYATLIDRVSKRAFEHVIPRFHIIRGVSFKPTVFTFLGKIESVGNSIKLTEEGRQFLVEYRKLIDYVAVSGWVRFTEQFSSAPKLHDKIEGSNLPRGSLVRWRPLLAAIQGGRCFYDDSHDMTQPEVDHVMPWSFVLEHRTWNLVLACRKCNNGKRDRLASPKALERLCARNEQIAKGSIGAGQAFRRHFAEWHSRDLSSHVRGLYDIATAEGFPLWE